MADAKKKLPTRTLVAKEKVRAADANGYQFASVITIVDGTQTPSYPVNFQTLGVQGLGVALFAEIDPPINGPFKIYYELLTYLAVDVGNTTIALPNNPTIVVVDLPNGMFTPRDEIAAALEGGTSPNGSTGVGPNNP